MRTKRRKGQWKNSNHIVRVRNSLMKHTLNEVSRSLGCPYQTCFEVLCDMFEEGHVLGKNTRDVLAQRILEKYT